MRARHTGLHELGIRSRLRMFGDSEYAASNMVCSPSFGVIGGSLFPSSASSSACASVIPPGDWFLAMVDTAYPAGAPITRPARTRPDFRRTRGDCRLNLNTAIFQ